MRQWQTLARPRRPARKRIAPHWQPPEKLTPQPPGPAGAPKHFASSNKARRGFCPECGTQLTFETEKWVVNVAIGAFDRPEEIDPTIQVGLASKLPYADHLAELPHRAPEDAAKMAEFYASVASNQHPDHDTEAWPPKP
jgi:Glutathione-dependent formaldehyde-activating enzyme